MEGAGIRNGEEKQTTENDYSFWDSTNANPAAVGILVKGYRTGKAMKVEYRPSEEDRKRRETIQDELRGMETSGFVSSTPKDGFKQWTSEDGKETRYVAQERLSAFDALKKEDEAIESRNTTRTVIDGSEGSFPTVSIKTKITIPLEDGTQLEYYRRRSDGSLMRQATLANGQVKRWVAGPPPDLSSFSAEEVNSMREAWRPE